MRLKGRQAALLSSWGRRSWGALLMPLLTLHPRQAVPEPVSLSALCVWGLVLPSLRLTFGSFCPSLSFTSGSSGASEVICPHFFAPHGSFRFGWCTKPVYLFGSFLLDINFISKIVALVT